MLSRTQHSSVVGRSASMRRLRRRTGNPRLYCSTNGCTSFLIIDADHQIASCEVCGYTRRLH